MSSIRQQDPTPTTTIPEGRLLHDLDQLLAAMQLLLDETPPKSPEGEHPFLTPSRDYTPDPLMWRRTSGPWRSTVSTGSRISPHFYKILFRSIFFIML